MRTFPIFQEAAPAPATAGRTRQGFVRAQAARQAAWLVACTLGAWSVGAHAASSASWASSEGVSASVGSLSASVQGLSTSSTRADAALLGTYRVVELAPQPGRPDLLAMRLERVAEQPAQEAGLRLVLPARAVHAAAIAAGDAVQVRELPQGLEFAHGQPARAFFLALREEGLGDLRTRPLAL